MRDRPLSPIVPDHIVHLMHPLDTHSSGYEARRENPGVRTPPD